MCIGQLDIVEENRVLAYIHGNAWNSSCSDSTDNTLLSNTQAMFPVHHLFSALAICGSQYCVFVDFIQQENAYMIKVKLFTDHRRNARQKFMQISNRCDGLGNLRNCLKLRCTLFDAPVYRFEFCSTLCQFGGPFLNSLFQ